MAVAIGPATRGRRFTKMKFIDSYLRSSMGQMRFPNPAILFIVNELAWVINMEDAMDEIAAMNDFATMNEQRFEI